MRPFRKDAGRNLCGRCNGAFQISRTKPCAQFEPFIAESEHGHRLRTELDGCQFKGRFVGHKSLASMEKFFHEPSRAMRGQSASQEQSGHRPVRSRRPLTTGIAAFRSTYPATRSSANATDIRITITAVATTSRSANSRRIKPSHPRSFAPGLFRASKRSGKPSAVRGRPGQTRQQTDGEAIHDEPLV
jgi:hypothetical protein